MSGVFQHHIVDAQGNVLPAASVEVRHQISGTLATIYSDYELTTPVGNPIAANENGFVRFYVANGEYHITASDGDDTVGEWVHHPIGLTVTGDIASDISDIYDALDDRAQEIADTVADIDRAGEAILENQMRLFRIGRPLDEYGKFELATSTLVLQSGVSLQEQFNTIETDTLLLGQNISLLGAKNESSTAFILDVDTVQIGGGVTLGQKFTEIDAVLDGLGEFDFDAIATAIEDLEASVTVLDGDIVAVASDVTLLDTRLTTAEGGVAANASAITVTNVTVSSQGSTLTAQASTLTSLSSTVGGHTSSIATLSSTTATQSGDITTLFAKYGVSLNVGGYITGFVQANNGTSGTFDILTDKFRVVNPAGGGTTPRTVFTIVGSDVWMENITVGVANISFASISNLQAINTNTGALTVSGQLTLNSSGSLRINKTSAADTTSGIWLGTDGSSNYDFHIGNSTNYLRWDGSAGSLTLAGTVTLPGAFVSSDVSGAEIARNDTNVSGGDAGGGAYQTLHQFSVYGTGTIAVRVNASRTQTGVTNDSGATVRVLRNGSTVVGSAQTITTGGGFAEYAWTGITVTAVTDTFQVQIQGGTSHTDFPPTINYNDQGTLDWTSVRAVWQLGTFF